ncbi:MAG: malate synthase G, partial [Burkholderiaceae bacterium]
MSAPFLPIHGIEVDPALCAFIDQEVLPDTGISPNTFWAGFDQIVAEFAPQNDALLAERDRLQAELDAWHQAHPGPITDMAAYQSFLSKIGYLVAEPGPVKASTANVDDELAVQAGPQLVVPVLNARYTL